MSIFDDIYTCVIFLLACFYIEKVIVGNYIQKHPVMVSTYKLRSKPLKTIRERFEISPFLPLRLLYMYVYVISLI